MGKKLLRGTILRYIAGLFLCMCMMFFYITQPTLLQQGDRLIYDVFLRLHGGGEPSPTPALVDLDEKSLQEFGQWPWPRHLVAKLVTILTESGAAAIGLDILLAEPDATSIKNIQSSFAKHFNITIPLEGIPKNLHDNDKILASILSQTPTVLGSYARFVGEKIALPENLPTKEGIVDRMVKGGKNPRSLLLKAHSATLPLAELRHIAPIGTLNVAPDPDGIIRSIPLVIQVDNRIFISLSLRALMQGMGTTNLMLIGGADGLQAVRVGKYTLPVTPDGRFMVPFRGPRGYYPTFRAADILNRKILPAELAGRVLIVGTSAPGLLDIRATPFDSVYPGAEVHATVIDAILSNKHITIPHWIPGAQISSIALVGLLGTISFSLAPAIIYLPILIALVSGAIMGSIYIFTHGIFISPLYTLLTITALAVTLLAVRFWQEAQQKRTLRNAFSRYIAPDMVARIVDRGEAVLAGEERVATLMFTDIRGFTSMSEKLSPDQVVGALNRYFTPMTSIIRNNSGTLDKFIGDAIMAFWNAPLDVPMHELKAINSAMKMQAALIELNKELQEDLEINFAMGAGVHTGKVYVGNMGSAELLDYTCIGDTVNLASRLEGLCPVYGVGVVTSKVTADKCIHYVHDNPTLTKEDIPYFIPLDSIRVKGKTEPIEIYSPITQEEASLRAQEIEFFLKAKNAYSEGDFALAKQMFITLHQDFPNNVLYRLYLERSTELLAHPPQNWQGVWTFTKK